MGQFSGASEPYGVPLSFIHPADNNFQKARYSPILLDPRLKLTRKQRDRLQQQIDDLASLGRNAREKAIDKLIKNALKSNAPPPKKTPKKAPSKQPTSKTKEVGLIAKRRGISRYEANLIRKKRNANR